MSDPIIPTEAHYARLAQHRAAGWDIGDRRDGFALFSALKREASSITYVVASSIVELVRKLDAIEAGGEQVPGDVEQAARRAAAGARERAEEAGQ